MLSEHCEQGVLLLAATAAAVAAAEVQVHIEMWSNSGVPIGPAGTRYANQSALPRYALGTVLLAMGEAPVNLLHPHVFHIGD